MMTVSTCKGVLGDLKAKIEALHQPEECTPGVSRCVECLHLWPCNTVKLVRGERVS